MYIYIYIHTWYICLFVQRTQARKAQQSMGVGDHQQPTLRERFANPGVKELSIYIYMDICRYIYIYTDVRIHIYIHV